MALYLTDKDVERVARRVAELVFDKTEITKLYTSPRGCQRADKERGTLFGLTNGAGHSREAGRRTARGAKDL